METTNQDPTTNNRKTTINGWCPERELAFRWAVHAMKAPLPKDEPVRPSGLWQYRILETPLDGAFARVAETAAISFRVPIAIVTPVDHDRIWFKWRREIDTSQVEDEARLCAPAISLAIRLPPARGAAFDSRAIDDPLGQAPRPSLVCGCSLSTHTTASIQGQVAVNRDASKRMDVGQG